MCEAPSRRVSHRRHQESTCSQGRATDPLQQRCSQSAVLLRAALLSWLSGPCWMGGGRETGGDKTLVWLSRAEPPDPHCERTSSWWGTWPLFGIYFASSSQPPAPPPTPGMDPHGPGASELTHPGGPSHLLPKWLHF